LKEIQKETGHQNSSLRLTNLPAQIKEEIGGYPIREGQGKRVLCLWDSVF
jgi:hypothetical protein